MTPAALFAPTPAGTLFFSLKVAHSPHHPARTLPSLSTADLAPQMIIDGSRRKLCLVKGVRVVAAGRRIVGVTAADGDDGVGKRRRRRA